MDSPLFPIISKDVAYVIRQQHRINDDLTAWKIAKDLLSGSYSSEDLNNQIPISNHVTGPVVLKIDYTDKNSMTIASVEAAEDRLIAIARTNGNNVSLHQTNSLTLPVANHINVGLSRIAKRTRRGPGNIVLAGESVIRELKRHSSSNTFEEVEHEKHGRWNKVGKLFYTVDVYSGDIINDNEVICVYSTTPNSGSSGIIDGPACLIENNGRLYFFELMFSLSRSASIASDYVDQIIFTDLA